MPKGRIGRYYINYRRRVGEDFSVYMFDSEGIPLTCDETTRKWYYNPVTISQFALKNYNLFTEGNDPERRDLFLKLSRKLLRMAERGVSGSWVWYYKIPIPFYVVDPLWISGMAQGEALSVLLRAYLMTEEDSFIKVAKGAMRSFNLRIDEGGVASTFPDGSLVFEEIPSYPPSCILNGFIFALFGIYDYWRVTGDERVHCLFKEAVRSLKGNLFRYDTGYWSLYDLWQPQRVASYQYHSLHIEQLQTLHRLSGEDQFRRFAEKMARYRKEFKSLFRWLMTKGRGKFISQVNDLSHRFS